MKRRSAEFADQLDRNCGGEGRDPYALLSCDHKTTGNTTNQETD